MSTSKKQVPLWLVLTLIAVIVIVGGAFFVFAKPLVTVFGASSEESNSQSLRSITRAEEVTLLVLGVEGIEGKKTNGKFLGLDIPGSGRATFLKYGFDAKLGIDGEKVVINETGENSYLISIPEFIVIGVSDQNFELAVADNELLSWTTPDISQAEMINKIVNADFEQKYIDDNEEILQEQARTFYTGIAEAVAPDVTLEFEFAQ